MFPLNRSNEARMRLSLDSPVRRGLPVPLILLAAAVVACNSGERRAGDTSASAAATSDTTAKCGGDNAGLTLPAGICNGVRRQHWARPTHRGGIERRRLRHARGDSTDAEESARRAPAADTDSVVRRAS